MLDEPKQSQESSRLEIGIYGSCVSRDSLPFITASPVVLHYYVARQALASAMGGASELTVDVSDIRSPFQQRMILGDLNSSLRSRVAESPPPSILLWDLIDDRYGYYETPAGAKVTNSAELSATSFEADWGDQCHFTEFGSSRYFAQLNSALDVFKDFLIQHNILEQSLFLSVPLTDRPDRTELVSSQTQRNVSSQVSKLNPHFQQVREMVSSAGLPVLDFQEEEVSFAASHRWGPASFHYSPDFYRRVASSIESSVGLRSRIVFSPQGVAELSTPTSLTQDQTLTCRFDSNMSGLVIEGSISSTARSKPWVAVASLRFRDSQPSNIRGANFSSYHDIGFYIYLSGDGERFSREITWDGHYALEEVLIYPWQTPEPVRIESLSISPLL